LQSPRRLIELEFGSGIQLRISGAVDPDLVAAGDKGDAAAMIPISSGVRVWDRHRPHGYASWDAGIGAASPRRPKAQSPRRRSLRFSRAQKAI